MPVERIAGQFVADVFGQCDRQRVPRGRNDAAIIAMDDRNGAAPVPLARDAPVPKAIVHLTFALRPIPKCRGLKALRHIFLAVLDRLAVKEPRIDQAAVAVIGRLRDDEGRWILIGRTDDRRISQPIGIGEIKVALVMGGTAEDGPGAVVHEDEVGHVDRQKPIVVKGMLDPDSRVEALLLCGLESCHGRAHAAALFDEGCEFGVCLSCLE